VPVQVHRELVYSTVPGYRPLELDLYIGDRPRALCVWLHGGGWRVGTRRNGPGPAGTGARHLERMAERGIAVAATEYRLSGEATFPAQLDDVVAACRYLDGSAVDLGVDGLPLVLWGTSAGAHLAGLCTFASPVGGAVTAVASWSGPVDPAALPDDLDAAGLDGDRGPGSREAMLLGAPAGDVPDLARAASPIHQVRPSSARFLLVHGTADVNIPLAQTERYGAALAGAGIDVRTMLVDGADHFYGSIPDHRLREVVDATIDFLLESAS
jgi:acetyl esterase/lipase